MRPWAILTAVTILGTGCTHTALERRTVKQASTLTDLQHQQVLDNLAMFACNPDAMAWHVKVKGGLVQVADQGSGTFGAEFGLLEMGYGSKFIPGVSGQRGVVNQWEVDPTVEAGELELLGLAYRKAVNPADPELPEKIRLAIWQLSLAYEVRPGFDVLGDIMVDGMKDNFKDIRISLQKGNFPLDEVDPTSPSNKTWANHLKDAEDALENAIKKQQRGEGNRVDRQIAAVDLSAALQGPLSKLVKRLDAKNDEQNDEWKKARRSLNMLLDDEEVSGYRKHLTDLPADGPAKGEKDWPTRVKEWQAQKHLLVTCLVFELGDYINDPELWKKKNHKEVERSAVQSFLRHFTPPASGLEPAAESNDRAHHHSPVVHLLAHIVTPGGEYFPVTISAQSQPRNRGLVDQAQEKLEKLKKLLNDDTFNSPWLFCGRKCDVPKCACYVGHYRGCGRDCYVWVMPDRARTLREFTLTVLALAPIDKQEGAILGGAAFSPSLR